MGRSSTALTGAAGEHFVAYKLSAMGYPVAMTRGGSPTIDLMVGDLSGHAAVSIQVKTSRWAYRRFVKSPEKNHWEWDVSHKARLVRSESIFYAFVDLKWGTSEQPDVFIVHSRFVADVIQPEWKKPMYWVMESSAEHHKERWDYITDRLTPNEPLSEPPQVTSAP